MSEKIDVKLKDIQETLLLPLWGRAIESQKKDPLLLDKTANEVINKINYDFTKITKNVREISRLGWVARSLTFDRIIKQFLEKYPRATIVNIGCGLDTTFDRIDNGNIYWYDLDLPDVIKLRSQFIKEDSRRRFIINSFLNYEWLDSLKIEENILFIAGGVFYYFEENQIKEFFNKISDSFSECEIAFDATSRVKLANKMVVKRSGMGEESFLKWELKNAKKIKLWDNKIKLIGEYPLFKIIRHNLDFKNKIQTLISDLLKLQYIVHLKIEEL